MENTKFDTNDDFFVSTGFNSLDETLGGLRSSCLYALGGAPGIGKTTFALSLLQKAAENNVAVGVFSYEMTETQILHRLLSMKCGIPSEKISTQKLEEYEFQMISNIASEFSKLKIFIDTSRNLKLDELVTKSKELKEKENIQLLIIDDVQRIPIDDSSREYASNREQEISANVRELKRLARELNIPILMISQLNRMFETRGGDKRPFLSDLRDSGAIENDSDVVLFLYRAEYYGIFTNESGASTAGKAEISIAKNRHGRMDTIELLYNPNIPVFDNFTNVPLSDQLFSFDNDHTPF